MVTPEGERGAAVEVRGGEIASVHPLDEADENLPTLDAGESVVFPGVVDTHVHVNEPGRTEWEGFATATRAAAAGGVTTLVDMPLNSIPSTTDVGALEEKREAADGRCHVDVGFWGGVVPGNAGTLEELHREGVLGFKCFRIDSGVDEFPHVGRRELEEAMPVLAELDTVLLVHAELPGPVEEAQDVWEGSDPTSYEVYARSRPPAAEVEAIEEMIELADAHDCRVHVVHLAAGEAIASTDAARTRGVPVSVETCPHYLTFAAQDVPDGGTAYKCAPPLRDADNREALWEGLEQGSIDLIATDHSPSPAELKAVDSGRLDEAWGGVASLQLTLSAVWTAARRRDAGVEDVAEWMCEAPAELAGIADRKGRIEPGSDADFAIWDPESQFEVAAEELEHRHPVTPYDGRRLEGVVEATVLRGSVVFDDGEFRGRPAGEFVSGRV